MNAKLITSMTAMLVASVYGSLANAAFLDCPISFTTDSTAKVYYSAAGTIQTAASDCEYLSPPDQSTVANETNVNAGGGFFSFSDWSITSVNQQSIEALTGTWSIPDVNFATRDYIITFKDGSGTNLISFLLNEEASSGSWSSPFTNPPFDTLGSTQTKDVSHLSIFYRTPGNGGGGGGGGGGSVPEPGVLFLMGAGLLGLGMARRRKSA